MTLRDYIDKLFEENVEVNMFYTKFTFDKFKKQLPKESRKHAEIAFEYYMHLWIEYEKQKIKKEIKYESKNII